MKTLLHVTAVAVLSLMVVGNVTAQFYYGGGEAISLNIDSTRVTIRFDESIPVMHQQALLESIGRIEAVLQDEHVIDDVLACSLDWAAGW